MPMPMKDVSGYRSGKLTAIRVVGKRGKSNLWECACDCGFMTTAIATQITLKTKTSCGCAKREPRKPRPDVAAKNKSRATHGMSLTRTFSSWRSMKHRCESKGSKDFSNYGGRGIRVCDEWSDSFLAFYEHMGERPFGMSLDRIDPNGNYEPGNVRWANNRVQSNNKRVNRYIEFKGVTMTVTEWAREVGIESKTLLYRVKNGWDIEVALATPSTIKRK